MPRRACAAIACLLAVGGAWLTIAASPAAAAGQLAYEGCVADTAAQGCFDLAFAPRYGAHGLAVSLDGKSVYVASKFSGTVGGSVAPFFRESPGGQLHLDGCLANDASQGCVDLAGNRRTVRNQVSPRLKAARRRARGS